MWKQLGSTDILLTNMILMVMSLNTKHVLSQHVLGYSQQQGIDYKDTNSPTTRLSTIRITLQIVANLGGIPKQMDIKTAYLNARIEENVYMVQNEGFENFDPDGNPLVCKLNTSIYGLKQSGRNWFLTLKEHLKTIGLKHAFMILVHSSKKGITLWQWFAFGQMILFSIVLKPYFNNGLQERCQ